MLNLSNYPECQPNLKYIKPLIWRGQDVNENDQVHFRISIFGQNSTGEPTLWRIEDFFPRMYIKLPNGIEWTDSKVSKVVNKLNSILKNQSIHSYKLLFKKCFYYYSEEKYPVILVTFQSLEAMKHCVDILKKPVSFTSNTKIDFQVMESQIDQVFKLIALKNLEYHAPLQGKCQQIKENEFTVSWNSLELVPKEIGKLNLT